MITLNSSELPPQLRRLHQVPYKLYAVGSELSSLIARPRLAVIGSRKMSPYGKEVTSRLVNELARDGVVIISGLALGVDSTAHTACLQAHGTTIAVLPAGLDRIYPATHTALACEIIDKGGALVSEYKPGTEPMKHHFIARDRIIAGLAEGLLITEAALKSGTMHTVATALELGIPVMAVPGPITSPSSEGTNNLIKTGAIPITSAQDIRDAMGLQQATPEEIDLTTNTPEEHIILQLLASGVRDGSLLQSQSQLDVSAYHRTITMLELQGRVQPLGANLWTLK